MGGFKASVFTSLNGFLGLSVLLLTVCHPVRATSISCDLDALVRPVILSHGYRSSFLYNSTDNYQIEWVDLEDFAPGNEGRGVGDLDLPLTWDASSLTQDKTDVGPESFDGDDMPSIFLPDGTLTPILNVVSDRMDQTGCNPGRCHGNIPCCNHESRVYLTHARLRWPSAMVFVSLIITTTTEFC